MEKNESAIFEGLNDEQKKAVGSVDGPVRDQERQGC